MGSILLTHVFYLMELSAFIQSEYNIMMKDTHF